MIFDYCCGLGAFPFRRLDDADPEGLVRLLDAEGIDAALVSAFETVLYRNVQAANELLAERIGQFPDRLFGAATVNPAYTEAVRDAGACIREMGMKALRLMPGFHDYGLSDAEVGPVLHAAGEMGVPVSIVMRVEDERQRHCLLRPRSITADEIAHALRAFPAVHFVLERPSARETLDLASAAPEATNWSVEISGRFLFLREPLQGGKSVIETLGPERLLFGSDAPLQYPRPAILKLEDLGLPAAQLRKVQHENAQRLLRA